MKIKVILTEEQLRKLNETKELVLEIDINDSNVEQEPTFTDWPDTKGCKPAEILIERLKKTDIMPHELPHLSRQRVARLVRHKNTTGATTIAPKTWDKVKATETALGISFQDYDSPANEIQSRVEKAFTATIGNNREEFNSFMRLFSKPIPHSMRFDHKSITTDAQNLGYRARNEILGFLGIYNEIDLKSLSAQDIRSSSSHPYDKNLPKFMSEFFR